MNSTDKKFTYIEDASDRLSEIECKTRGLLYALAALVARPPDNCIVCVPHPDEANGLVWLAKDLGERLSEVSLEISHHYGDISAARHAANSTLREIAPESISEGECQDLAPICPNSAAIKMQGCAKGKTGGERKDAAAAAAIPAIRRQNGAKLNPAT
jgi:hypothetical protein